MNFIDNIKKQAIMFTFLFLGVRIYFICTVGYIDYVDSMVICGLVHVFIMPILYELFKYLEEKRN